MTTPPNGLVVAHINNDEDTPPSTLEGPRLMTKWALSIVSNSANFLPKGELSPHQHLPTA
jgi:hypothetical protein